MELLALVRAVAPEPTVGSSKKAKEARQAWEEHTLASTVQRCLNTVTSRNMLKLNYKMIMFLHKREAKRLLLLGMSVKQCKLCDFKPFWNLVKLDRLDILGLQNFTELDRPEAQEDSCMTALSVILRANFSGECEEQDLTRVCVLGVFVPGYFLVTSEKSTPVLSNAFTSLTNVVDLENNTDADTLDAEIKAINKDSHVLNKLLCGLLGGYEVMHKATEHVTKMKNASSNLTILSEVMKKHRIARGFGGFGCI